MTDAGVAAPFGVNPKKKFEIITENISLESVNFYPSNTNIKCSDNDEKA